MPEFLTLLPPKEALHTLISALPVAHATEIISTEQALHRVTAEVVLAPHALPEFPRSTVDGYAVRANDTYGASDGLPVYLGLAGEAPMGEAPSFEIGSCQCMLIHTGGMLPGGADAVVMLEHTQQEVTGEIEITRAVASGENRIEVGEDVKEGQEVIGKGVRLGPAEIGGLMALGITSMRVIRRPRIGLISSGDEVVPPHARPRPGQVRDVNAYSLSALVEEGGGEPRLYGIIPDQEEALFAAAQKALVECDVLLITAGSSASARDLTAGVINRLGKPGVLVHGVNVRPGKPTILGVCDGKPAIGLPGNPVSALVIARLFVIPVIDLLSGFTRLKPQPVVAAHITLNLASQAGREDWMPVRLTEQAGVLCAEPIFGKSNLIFTLARADGLIRIPADTTGLVAGEQVEVYPF